MASNVRVQRWVHVGPRDSIVDMRRELETRHGACNVQIGNVITIESKEPLTPAQVERFLELAQQGKFDAFG